MTQFEIAKQQVAEGKLQPPSVGMGTENGVKNIDYFGYQLAVHKMNLSIMAAGMLCRGITFTQIKKYYGLKGRSAKDCLGQFEKIMDDYKAELDAKRQAIQN